MLIQKTIPSIRLLRIFARKLVVADFCNKIGTKEPISRAAGRSVY